MPLTIPVAHDYSCGWCWIALSQTKRLQAEFDVEFEWRGYELYPEAYEWPESTVQPEPNPDRPPTPTRFRLALAAEGLGPPPPSMPKRLKTFRTHQAAEFAREQGCFEAFNDRVYHALWRHGLNINSLDTLRLLATGLISNIDGMVEAIEERRYNDRIVKFDDPAYASGVYNLPNFWIGESRLAEQPYPVLQKAISELIGTHAAAPVYGALEFGSASGRPFIFMNMVSTLDGKILTGNRDEPVMDLGSKTDHATMRYLESLADGVIIGAGSLRATPGLWYDSRLLRFVVTESGHLNFSSRFFTDAPHRAVVLSPREPEGLPVGVHWLPKTGWRETLTAIRTQFGVERLLCEGGSEMNASLLREDWVDELFLTLAPKIKLGREVPTIADGDALDRSQVQNWNLVSEIRRGDEVFLRYRRPRA